MDAPLYLSAREAAAELGVSTATLYAYVSRGLVRSEPRPGSRKRLYRAEDIRALAARRDGEGSSTTASATPAGALDFGQPLLDSAITLIDGERLFYRGRDAAILSEAAGLESVATLLWGGEGDPFADHPAGGPRSDPLPEADAALPPIARAQAMLPRIAAADTEAFNTSEDGRRRTAARVLRAVAGAIAGRPEGAAGSAAGDRTGLPVHERLAEAWALPAEARDPLRAALVLSADHELNASTFAVRVAASTGATLYDSVLAGLATLRGPRHGGMTERAAALLDGLLAAEDPQAALTAALRRGDTLPGFGHRLYPAGDPRARALIRALARSWPDRPEPFALARLADAAERLAGRPPTLDAALAVLARIAGFPEGAALGVFAAGRTAGWLAHALEQQGQASLIRPRARYVGPRP
ncbi:MAG: citrate synthase family protein [Azospirillaceae bacterium]